MSKTTKEKRASRSQKRMVSLRQIQLALHRIQNQRKKDADRAIYGAEQALGWAAGLNYMNPAKVWNDQAQAG